MPGNERYAECLTYSVAPYPADYESYFLLGVLSQMDRSSGWSVLDDLPRAKERTVHLKRAAPGVIGKLAQLRSAVSDYFGSLPASSEAARSAFLDVFEPHLARCLIRCATAFNVTEASLAATPLALIRCTLLSGGKPLRGLAYLLPEGLFFTSSFLENGVEDQWAKRAYTVAVVDFADVVALLPSVALETTDGGPRWVMGIPSSSVIANCLQLFTRPRNQLLQLIDVEELLFFPAALPVMDQIENVARGVRSVPDRPLLYEQEIASVTAMPAALYCVVLVGVVQRLWQRRLRAVGLELPLSGVVHAERH